MWSKEGQRELRHWDIMALGEYWCGCFFSHSSLSGQWRSFRHLHCTQRKNIKMTLNKLKLIFSNEHILCYKYPKVLQICLALTYFYLPLRLKMSEPLSLVCFLKSKVKFTSKINILHQCMHDCCSCASFSNTSYEACLHNALWHIMNTLTMHCKWLWL